MMESRRYNTAGTILVIFAGGVVAHAYLHPFDPKKVHDEPTGIYSRISSLSPNLTVIGSGTLGTTISPGTGTLTLEGGQGRIV